MIRLQIDQNRPAREEMIKMGEELSSQMRNNQKQFLKMVEDMVIDTYSQIENSSQGLLGDVTKQIMGLRQKIKSEIKPS